MDELKRTPGVRSSNATAAPIEVSVIGRDGKPAVVGVSMGFWPEASDYWTTTEARFGRPGFLRGWPNVYTESKAMRRLIGKKGVKGTLSRTVDLLGKNDIRKEYPDMATKLIPGQSFSNATLVEAKKGWGIVKGFAVYDLLDSPEGESYVAYKHWWNITEDEAWVDLTPAEPGSHTATVQVRLLLQSELGQKEERLLEYGSHMVALALMQEKNKIEKAVGKKMAQLGSEAHLKKVEEMVQDSFGGGGGSAAKLSAESSLMMAPEAERLIETLRTFSLEEVGSDKWMTQHETLTRLNLQAHHNVAAMSDEFVKESFISFDKINLLVHELLLIEIWKDKVFPHISDNALENVVGSTSIYLCLFHESLLINLVEILLFHRESLEAMSGDTLLELLDYCHRQIVYMNSGRAKKDAEVVTQTMKEVLDQNKRQDLDEKIKDVRFGTAVSCLSVLRYMTDYGQELPLGVMARMLDTHDTIVQLVPLLEERPWVRRRVKGAGKDKQRLMEVFNEGRWIMMPPEERLKLGKADAQVWIALHNLITDPKCRGKYRYDDFRRDTVTRLQRYFNETLFDQIPMLVDLQRVISEVTFMVTPSSADMTQGRLIIEQVPEVRDGMLQRSDWKKIAKFQEEKTFADTPENLEHHRKKMETLVQTFDFMSLLQDGEMPDFEKVNINDGDYNVAGGASKDSKVQPADPSPASPPHSDKTMDASTPSASIVQPMDSPATVQDIDLDELE